MACLLLQDRPADVLKCSSALSLEQPRCPRISWNDSAWLWPFPHGQDRVPSPDDASPFGALDEEEVLQPWVCRLSLSASLKSFLHVSTPIAKKNMWTASCPRTRLKERV